MEKKKNGEKIEEKKKRRSCVRRLIESHRTPEVIMALAR
jgi:hypothetical protein